MSGPIKLSIIPNVLHFNFIIIILLVQFLLSQITFAAFLDETKLFTEQEKGNFHLLLKNKFVSYSLCSRYCFLLSKGKITRVMHRQKKKCYKEKRYSNLNDSDDQLTEQHTLLTKVCGRIEWGCFWIIVEGLVTF